MVLDVVSLSSLISLKTNFPLFKFQPLSPRSKLTTRKRANTLGNEAEKTQFPKGKETDSMNRSPLVLEAIPETQQGCVVNKEVLGVDA